MIFLDDFKVVSDLTKNKMKSNHYLKKGGLYPMQGKNHSNQARAKISEAATAQCKAYKGRFTYTNSNNTFLMKSSWEVKYAAYLDSLGHKWQYEPTFKLSNGTTYLPDFQLTTGDIIEVKGYMRRDAHLKWKMFCKEYPNLKTSLVTKIEMKKLGLIK